jgi:transcription elongation factor GreA
VDNNPNSDFTLGKCGYDFLNSITPENRSKAQEQINKFIRWIGPTRRITELTPLAISNYSEHTLVTEIKYVKSFLTFLRTQGFNTANLKVNLKGKKTSPKISIHTQKITKKTHSLTTSGYNKLKVELDNLKSQRIAVTLELRKAAADKDFRENAPLHAARERKSYIEGRIQEIESVLKEVKIIDRTAMTSGIKIGYTVILEELSSGKQLCYELVDSREANPTKGKFSVESPIGKALLNKEKDQIVEVVAPAGKYSYRVHEIRR